MSENLKTLCIVCKNPNIKIRKFDKEKGLLRFCSKECINKYYETKEPEKVEEEKHEEPEKKEEEKNEE